MRLALLLVLVSACRAEPERREPEAAASPRAEHAPVTVLPTFSLTTIDGTPLTSEDVRGKVTLVMYWASWCEPCVTEGPSIDQVFRRHAGDGFAMLGISRDTVDVQTLRAFRDRYDFTYPIAKADAALDEALGAPTQIPAFLLYGRDGRLRWRMTGALPVDILEREVVQALAAGETSTVPVQLFVVRDTRDAARLATALKRARAAGPILVVLVGEVQLPPRAANALGVDALVAPARPEGVAAPRVSQYQILRAGPLTLALLEPGAPATTAEAARRDGGAELVVGLAPGTGVDVVLGEPGPVVAYRLDATARKATPSVVDLAALPVDPVVDRLLR